MRNYVNTILFESALDSVAPNSGLLSSFIESFFSPSLLVVEEDCETTMGEYVPCSYQAEGRIETETGLPLTSTRLSTLIGQGARKVFVRSISTCVSHGGICRACLAGSRPKEVTPAVGNKFKFRPELTVDTEIINIQAGNSVHNLKYSSNQYDRLYVYVNGLLINENQYTVVDSTFTLNTPAVALTRFVIKYSVFTNSEYFYWLANTFSGSLLGIEPFSKIILPVKKQVLQDYIQKTDLEELVHRLKISDVAQEDAVQYIDSISDPVEKAIYVCVLCAIYLN